MTERTPPPAHLPHPPGSGATLRRNAWGQSYRLTEAAPVHDGTAVSTLSIIRWLDVEHQARWAPKKGVTYCNVYAHDLCAIQGAYLARVWWLPNSLAALQTGRDVAPLYGATVGELSANMLFRWLDQWSELYGWVRTDSLDDAQDAANRGDAVVICARQHDEAKPGHISCVVPETTTMRAKRDANDRVLVPVQSQAGGRNLMHGLTGRWWVGPEMEEFGIFIHNGALVRDTMPAPAPSTPPDTVPSTPPAIRRSSERMQATDAPIIDNGVVLPSAVTPLRAGPGEHTPLRSANDDSEPPPEAA